MIISVSANGEEMGFLPAEGVTVLFDKALAAGAEEVAKAYPLIRRELERNLQLEVDFSPTVILIKREKGLSKHGPEPPDHGVRGPRE